MQGGCEFMYLDERSKKLLIEVIKNPNVTSKDLQKDHHLSRRQVDYSFKKVNEWLEEQGKPAVEKNNGRYIVSKTIAQLFDIETENNVQFYIPSQTERVYLLILYIITSDEELSLNHFIAEMDVSKNTILQDLKEVKRVFSEFDLNLEYSRQEGYFAAGKEWNKRAVMLDSIYWIAQIYGGEQFLQRFMGISEEEVRGTRQQLAKIESELHLSFVDTEMESLPYAVEGIFKRINKGRHIDTEFFIGNDELSDTREYEAVNALVENKNFIPEEERLYLALQLLTSYTVKKKQYLKDKELPRLRQALQETLNEFEQKAVFPLVNKEELIDKLFLHFKPAYYRIKYNLTTDYRFLEKVSEEFEMLHYFVKKSVSPLRQFLGSDIPEKELMFITLFVGGHILENNEQTIEKVNKRAVVVCPNGLAVSKLMERNLQSIFPEIYFYPAMSVREFKNTEISYDLVFSSVPVTVSSDKRLFIVNQMMDTSEQEELRKVVMHSVFLFNEEQVNVNQLMDVISTYAEVNDEQKLLISLKKVLQGKASARETDVSHSGYSVHLDELLIEDTIQIVDRVEDWQEALEIASKPLLESGKISERYVKAIKEQYPELAEHIVLQGKIAIPHSETEKGVNGLGMSLLYMKEGIPNFDGSMLHFIVVIAAIDRKTHFTALMELMEFAGNNQDLEKLMNCETTNEAYKVITNAIIKKNHTS